MLARGTTSPRRSTLFEFPSLSSLLEARLSMTQVAEAGAAPQRMPLAVAALFLPDAGMPRVARIGRVRYALLFAMVCSIGLGVAQASRVDARASTLQQLEMQGKLPSMSDRQIEEAQKATERVYMVKKIGLGVVEAPFLMLLGAVGLFVMTWFLRGRAKGSEILTIATYGLLPGAIANAFEAGSSLLAPLVKPDAPGFVPRTLAALATAFGQNVSGPAAKVLGAIDVFDLWGAAMVAFGLATAANLPVRRAVIGTLVGWLCYRLVRFVAIGG